MQHDWLKGSGQVWETYHKATCPLSGNNKSFASFNESPPLIANVPHKMTNEFRFNQGLRLGPCGNEFKFNQGLRLVPCGNGLYCLYGIGTKSTGQFFFFFFFNDIKPGTVVPKWYSPKNWYQNWYFSMEIWIGL